MRRFPTFEQWLATEYRPIAGGAIQELQNHRSTIAKQTAKGTPNDTPVKRLVIAGGGDWNYARQDGRQPISDGTKYGGGYDWIDQASGAFNPVILATPRELGYVLYVYHGGETPTSAINEVETLTGGTATGGTFTLQFRDQVTAPIAYNATSAAIVAALVALTKVGAGGFTATGGPLNTTPVVLTAAAGLAGKELPTLVVNGAALTGGTSPTVVKTTPGAKIRHRFQPGTNFFYATMFRGIGGATVSRQNFNDCRITGMTLATARGEMPMRITPTGFSLDPAANKVADPTLPGIPAEDVFLHTNAKGAFTIDGTVFPGTVSLEFETSEDANQQFGDDTIPFDVTTGQPTVQVRPTVWLDQTALNLFNVKTYGTATPAEGARPLKTIGGYGTLNAQYRLLDQADGYVTGDRVDVDLARVKWNLPDAPGPNPAGGDAQLALVGDARPVGGNPAYTVDVYNSDAAYT